MAKFLDENGLSHLWSKLKALLNNKADFGHGHDAATTSAAGFMSAADKSKLNGIATGANKYTHPSYTSRTSGLYKVTVDGTGHVSGVAAVTKDDITALGIPGQDTNTTYGEATTSAAGLMSSSDKSKLDGITAGANKYVHPTYTGKSSGLYKITVDTTGHVSAATAVTKADITALGIPSTNTTYNTMGGATASAAGSAGLVPAPAAGKNTSFLRGDGAWVVPTNTTYNAATTSAAGLMSASDKSKLDGIASGANAYSHPTYTSKTSGLYKITVDGTGHISAATAVAKSDITALGIPAQDTVYTHPGYTAKSSGLYKVTVDSTGHVSATAAVAKSDITALGIPAQDTTYSAATQSANGLMSAADKKKLDGFAPVTTAGTGAAYTATVPGATLTAGTRITIVTHTVSTSTAPTLNVNSLGAKTIKRRLSSLVTSLQSGYSAGWLASGKPFTLMYDGTYWIVEDMSKPAAADLSGTLAISKGGTGKTTAAEALTALGGMPIAGGTFTGAAYAGSSVQTPGTSMLRNSKLVSAEETPTVAGEIFWTYG